MKNKRFVLYPIAVVVIILAGLLGSLSSIHVQNVYQSYYRVGYTDCYDTVVPMAFAQGWERGKSEGYLEGYIKGWTNGYKTGVFAVDDPYHVAALALEKQLPWLDVTLLIGNEDILTVVIIMPTEQPADYSPEVLNEGVVSLLESVYDGQEVVRIIAGQYSQLYGGYVIYFAFDFEPESLFEYRLGEGTVGQSLIYQVIPMPGELMVWFSNPFAVESVE